MSQFTFNFTHTYVQFLTVCWLHYDCHGVYSCKVSVVTCTDFRQNDFPQLKYALLGGLGLLALIQRE
jgi:hypothetical protein